MDRDCIFCEIIGGETEATIVYRDNGIVAFLDINPVTPGHTLVVPQAHLPRLSDVDASTGARLFNTAQWMALALRRSSLHCQGVNLFYADGEAAFQEVFHAHLHVFPRFDGDGFRLAANWGTSPGRDELEKIGGQIRDALFEVTSAEG